MQAAGPSTDAGPLLQQTQRLIEQLYGIEAPHAAEAFLLADPVIAQALHGDGWPGSDEMLLVCEDGDGLELSLFLDQSLLQRLDATSPHDALGAHNLADFLALVEGVSHFVYLTWNASRERSVTPLELELQGEVDKYALTTITWQRQYGGSPRGLHQVLFDRAQVDSSLTPDLQQRYRDANRYAGRYCLNIERRYLVRRERGLLGELRAFYREGRSEKLARIGAP